MAKRAGNSSAPYPPSVLNRIEEILAQNIQTYQAGGDKIMFSLQPTATQILEEFRSLVPTESNIDENIPPELGNTFNEGFNACRSEILDKIGGEK